MASQEETEVMHTNTRSLRRSEVVPVAEGDDRSFIVDVVEVLVRVVGIIDNERATKSVA